MKKVSVFPALLAVLLAACSPSAENDPIYRALLENRPTEVPARHMARLRRGLASCDIFNQGKLTQYMTCWWPGGRPVSGAGLYYYPPNPLSPPHPSKLIVPGGPKVTTLLF